MRPLLARHALTLLALLATLHALVYVPVTNHEIGDSPTFLAAGKALLHGSYSTPLRAEFGSATGYTLNPDKPIDLTDRVLPARAVDAPEYQAWRAPAYPAVIALVGGAEGGFSRALLFVVQALMIGAATLLTALTVQRLLGRRTAIVAAAVIALDPFSKRYGSLILSEALAMLFVALLAFAVVRARSQPGWRWWTVAGGAGGLLVLSRPGLAVLPLIAGAAAAATPGRALDRLRRAAVVAVAAALPVLPWLAWTTHVTGSTTLSSYGEGVNLLVAARGQDAQHTIFTVASTAAFQDDLTAARWDFPSEEQLLSDRKAHARYLARVDARLRDRALSIYRHEVRTHPLGVASDFAYRAYFLWMAHEDWYQPAGGPVLLSLRAFDWAVLALIVVGMVMAARRSRETLWLAAMLVAPTLILAAHEAQARFTIPLRPLALAFVGVALVSLFERFRRQGSN